MGEWNIMAIGLRVKAIRAQTELKTGSDQATVLRKEMSLH